MNDCLLNVSYRAHVKRNLQSFRVFAVLCNLISASMVVPVTSTQVTPQDGSTVNVLLVTMETSVKLKDLIKTCLDYWTSAIKPISRDYMLEDQSGKPYHVFCDFDSEKDIAWTLVESFSMNNVALLRPFSFTKDHPLNETNLNWDGYGVYAWL